MLSVGRRLARLTLLLYTVNWCGEGGLSCLTLTKRSQCSVDVAPININLAISGVAWHSSRMLTPSRDAQHLTTRSEFEMSKARLLSTKQLRQQLARLDDADVLVVARGAVDELLSRSVIKCAAALVMIESLAPENVRVRQL